MTNQKNRLDLMMFIILLLANKIPSKFKLQKQSSNNLLKKMSNLQNKFSKLPEKLSNLLEKLSSLLKNHFNLLKNPFNLLFKKKLLKHPRMKYLRPTPKLKRSIIHNKKHLRPLLQNRFLKKFNEMKKLDLLNEFPNKNLNIKNPLFNKEMFSTPLL